MLCWHEILPWLCMSDRQSTQRTEVESHWYSLILAKSTECPSCNFPQPDDIWHIHPDRETKSIVKTMKRRSSIWICRSRSWLLQECRDLSIWAAIGRTAFVSGLHPQKVKTKKRWMALWEVRVFCKAIQHLQQFSREHCKEVEEMRLPEMHDQQMKCKQGHFHLAPVYGIHPEGSDLSQWNADSKSFTFYTEHNAPSLLTRSVLKFCSKAPMFRWFQIV